MAEYGNPALQCTLLPASEDRSHLPAAWVWLLVHWHGLRPHPIGGEYVLFSCRSLVGRSIRSVLHRDIEKLSDNFRVVLSSVQGQIAARLAAVTSGSGSHKHRLMAVYKRIPDHPYPGRLESRCLEAELLGRIQLLRYPLVFTSSKC